MRVFFIENERGSAYVFVWIMMLSFLFIAGAALFVSAQGRRISARYANNAGLYDLSVSANERAFLLLCETLREKSGEIDTLIRDEISSEGVEKFLIYRNGHFFVESPKLNYYSYRFREIADSYFSALQTGFELFSYRLSVGATEFYDVKTSLDPLTSGGFTVLTEAVKTTRGTQSYPVRAGAAIKWQYPAISETLTPLAYNWRETVPAMFATGIYNPAVYEWENFGAADSLPDIWSENSAVMVFSAPEADISAYAPSGQAVPTLLVNTASGALRIFGSGAQLTEFKGIIISRGDVLIDGVAVSGSVIAAGTVATANGGSVTANTGILFDIPAPEETRRIIFDYLGLTHFSGTDTIASQVLGSVCITAYQLNVPSAPDFTLELTQMRRITD